MTKPTKYVAVSTQGLKRIAVWCDANARSPLAESYMAYCGGVGGQPYALDIVDSVADAQRSRAWCAAYRAADQAERYGFMARDTIGRMILKRIKAEASGSAASP